MKPPRAIAVVLLLAALTAGRVGAGLVLLPPPNGRLVFDLLGGAAAVWAASQFAAEDRPRRGWWLVAGTHWLLALAQVWAAIGPAEWRISGARALIIAANVCWPAAMIVFARALDSGLAGFGEGRGRALTWILGLPVVVVAGYVGWLGIDEHLLTGPATANAAWIAGSDAVVLLADAVVFTATVRLLTAVAPVLDGSIVRTYALIGVSAVLSLATETLSVLEPRMGLEWAGAVMRWLHPGAWAAVTTAACLQALLLRSLSRGRGTGSVAAAG